MQYRIRGGGRAAISTILVAVLVLGVVGACDLGTTRPEVVRIGAVYPLEGSLATTGADIRQGLDLATEIINGEYDLDMPLARTAGLPNLGRVRIEIVYADHGGDPDQAVAEVQRLVSDENVSGLLGCYNSSVTSLASQMAESLEVPFVNPDSTSPVLTEQGFRWFFRTTADDAIFVANFFEFLADLESERQVAPGAVAIVYENSLFGTGVGQLEVQHAHTAGLQVAVEVPYAADASNIDREVQEIAASNAPLVMQSSYDSDAILFMQGYKAVGYRPEAILAMDAGFISPGFIETLKDDANYVLSREVWAPDLGVERPLVEEVNDLYRQRYGRNLTGNSARAFTALVVLADAFNRAGSTEAEKVREALLDTDIPAEQLIMPWDGVRFDPETGQNTLARGIIVQIQDQAYHTVWPWDLASRDLVWPMPAWGE